MEQKSSQCTISHGITDVPLFSVNAATREWNR